MTTNIHRKASARRARRHILTVLMAAVAICAGTACGDDLLERDDTDLDGGQHKATFEIALSSITSAQRTRAGEEKDLIDMDQIKEVWIGVFDHQSNKLISSWPREDVGKVEDYDDDGKTIKAKISFLYNDKTTTQVKIAAVANYSGIIGHITKKQEGGWTDKEEKIEDLLKEVETWEDYLSISVDTESATEVAQTTGYCIMSSIATKETKTAALPTADLKTDTITTNDATCLFETNGYSGPNITAYLYLRRLVVHNTVNVFAGENINLRNVRYRVFNIPMRSYVQERTMTVLENEEWAALESWEDCFDRSPNASDFHVDGKPLYKDDEEDDEEKVVETSTTTEGQEYYTFSFSHYDNKHWGLKGGVCTAYNDREKIWTGKTDALGHEVYSSLCLAGDKPYNNYASYFQIMADVEETDSEGNTIRSAQAVYTIHEGYCNAAKLTAETDSEKKSRDFMAVRNTKYTYKVTINGLKGMTLQVGTATDETQSGVTGTITGGSKLTEVALATGTPIQVEIPTGEDADSPQPFSWLFKDEEGKFHGSFSSEMVTRFSGALGLPTGDDAPTSYSWDEYDGKKEEIESLLGSIEVTKLSANATRADDGDDVDKINFWEMVPGETYRLTFKKSSVMQMLYLVSSPSSADGRTTIQNALVHFTSPYYRRWDFTNWSETTVNNLKADATGWSHDEKGNGAAAEQHPDECYWQVGSSSNTSNGETLMANGTPIAETSGLLFTNSKPRALAIAVNYPHALSDYHDKQYLWLGSNDINYFIIPNVAPGSMIKMGVESHKDSDARGVELYVGHGNNGTKLKDINGKEINLPTVYEDQEWYLPSELSDAPNGDGSYDITVRNTNGCHIYYIEVDYIED